MNGTSGFQEVRSSPPDHQQIGCCTSNGINSEQVPGTFSALTILTNFLTQMADSKKVKRDKGYSRMRYLFKGLVMMIAALLLGSLGVLQTGYTFAESEIPGRQPLIETPPTTSIADGNTSPSSSVFLPLPPQHPDQPDLNQQAMEEVKKSTIRSNSVISVHHVMLNKQKLFNEILKAPSFKIRPVVFTLSEDTSVTVVTDRLRTTDYGLSWAGHIQDNPRSSVLILANTKTRTISGEIRIDGKVYEIRPGKRGSYAVFAMEPSRLPPDHSSKWYETPPESHVPGNLFPSTATSNVPRSLVRSTAIMAISRPVIDVMVLYTQKAINANLSYDIAQQICDAITQVQESFNDSGVTAQVRLVHRGRINFTESGDPELDAQHLMEKTFGSKSAHGNRSKYGADLVSLWIGDEGVDMCGAAQAIPQLGGSGSGGLAFSVVRRNCATSNLTFAHELGHLMGAYHDRFNAGASTDPNHNYGYIRPDKNWKTIMAVDRMDCPLVSSTNPDATITTSHFCERLKVWSNPAKTSSAGDAMGRPDDPDKIFTTGCTSTDPATACDGPADNATTLNDNAFAVSQFMSTGVLGKVSCSTP